MSTTQPHRATSTHVIARARVPVQVPATASPPPSISPAPAPAPSPSPSPRPAGRGLLAYWFVTPVQTGPIRVALAEAGYIGVALVAGGFTILLARYWFTLTEMRTAALLAAFAVVFGGLGLAMAGGPRNLPTLAAAADSVRRGVAGSMFALAAGWTAGAVGVYANGHAWFAGSAVGLIVAVAGYVALPTAAGVLAGITLGVFLAISTVDELASLTPLSVGTTLVAFAVLLAVLSMAGLIRQQELGLSLAALIALVGAQQPVARADSFAWAYGLTLAVGVTCFAVYRKLAVTALLPVGVIGVSIGVLEGTWDHASGTVGVALTLAITGAALIATSGLGLQLWHTRGEPRRIRHF
jgi:hypothetical protein